MKRKFNKTLVGVLASFAMFLGCSDDEITPALTPNQIEDYDLVQVSTATPDVIVDLGATGADLSNVTVDIVPDGGATPVASNSLRQIIHNSLNRVKISVPFPLPEEAPSGLYSIRYRMEYQGGDVAEASYKVNIVNVKVKTPAVCAFPQLPLPEGKNVWVQVTAPETTGEDDVYVVGNFMVANGADGDWNPGNTAFRMTRVPGSNCYYIAVNLQSGDQLKFTRGSWSTVMKDENGNDYRDPSNNPRAGHNGDGNILFGTAPYAVGSTLKFTILNWADNVIKAPSIIPAGAIKSGHTTIVANVNSGDDAVKYYLVKENATSLEGAVEMIRITGTSKMAGAVPKVANDKYIVVKGVIAKKGINSFDVVRTVTLDGVANPIEVNVPGFRGELQVTPVPANLFIVGGATPGGWNNPVPTPSQQFNRNGNVFTLTLALASAQGYLLLPVNGSWDQKFGWSGNALEGDLIPQGGDFQSPAEAGTYLITADFNTGRYTLTKQ